MLTVEQCEFALEDLRRRKRIIGDKNEEYTDHLERLQLAYTKELGKALKRDNKKIGVKRHPNGKDIRL